MAKFYKSEDKDSLICQIEINDKCVTVYGRVNDNHSHWAPEMQKLIDAISPKVGCHRSDEERATFHPKGSPKKIGYKYFHHVHSDFDLEETLNKVKPWLPKDLEEQLNAKY